MELEERLDFIEFRMDLLRTGSEFCKYLYDREITRKQLSALYDIMDYFREKIDSGQKVSSAEYETKVLDVVDRRKLDYHFCELFAKFLWEEERYDEVFPALYGESQKFKHLFK